jgi:hypothetical protein
VKERKDKNDLKAIKKNQSIEKKGQIEYNKVRNRRKKVFWAREPGQRDVDVFQEGYRTKALLTYLLACLWLRHVRVPLHAPGHIL